jgi:hypothetical protein
MTEKIIELVIYPWRSELSGLYYWTDQVLLCERHKRRIKLQPFLVGDEKEGFGRFGCPFCPGGLMENTFYLHPTHRAMYEGLKKFEKNVVYDPAFKDWVHPMLKETFVWPKKETK